MTASRQPLLTDEKIENFGSMRIGNLGKVCYVDGARFARSICEAKISVLRKELKA